VIGDYTGKARTDRRDRRTRLRPVLLPFPLRLCERVLDFPMLRSRQGIVEFFVGRPHVRQARFLHYPPRSVVASPGPPVALLQIKELPVKRTIALLWSAGRFQSAAARAFLAFAQSHLQTRDGQDR